MEWTESEIKDHIATGGEFNSGRIAYLLKNNFTSTIKNLTSRSTIKTPILISVTTPLRTQIPTPTTPQLPITSIPQQATPTITQQQDYHQTPAASVPPQPVQQQYNSQQSLPAATASTLPPATAPTPPGPPLAQYLHPGTTNTNPNMQLHMDQPTYDPCFPQNKTFTKAEQKELHKAKFMAKERE